MTDTADPPSSAEQVKLVLALTRLHGGASLKGAPLEAAEQVAAELGRDLILDEQQDGTVAVLAWPVAGDPQPSRRAPRLARRELRESALRTFVVVYAMLTAPRPTQEDDPPAPSRVALDDVVRVADEVVGVGPTWAVSALRRDLLFSGLLVAPRPDTFAFGPAVAALDRLQRDQLDAAVVRLRRSPLWPAAVSA